MNQRRSSRGSRRSNSTRICPKTSTRPTPRPDLRNATSAMKRAGQLRDDQIVQHAIDDASGLMSARAAVPSLIRATLSPVTGSGFLGVKKLALSSHPAMSTQSVHLRYQGILSLDSEDRATLFSSSSRPDHSAQAPSSSSQHLQDDVDSSSYRCRLIRPNDSLSLNCLQKLHGGLACWPKDAFVWWRHGQRQCSNLTMGLMIAVFFWGLGMALLAFFMLENGLSFLQAVDLLKPDQYERFFSRATIEHDQVYAVSLSTLVLKNDRQAFESQNNVNITQRIGNDLVLDNARNEYWPYIMQYSNLVNNKSIQGLNAASDLNNARALQLAYNDAETLQNKSNKIDKPHAFLTSPIPFTNGGYGMSYTLWSIALNKSITVWGEKLNTSVKAFNIMFKSELLQYKVPKIPIREYSETYGYRLYDVTREIPLESIPYNQINPTTPINSSEDTDLITTRSLLEEQIPSDMLMMDNFSGEQINVGGRIWELHCIVVAKNGMIVNSVMPFITCAILLLITLLLLEVVRHLGTRLMNARAERRQLETSKQLFNALKTRSKACVETIPNPMILLDLNGFVVGLNKHAAVLVPQDIVAKVHIRDIIVSQRQCIHTSGLTSNVICEKCHIRTSNSSNEFNHHLHHHHNNDDDDDHDKPQASNQSSPQTRLYTSPQKSPTSSIAVYSALHSPKLPSTSVFSNGLHINTEIASSNEEEPSRYVSARSKRLLGILEPGTCEVLVRRSDGTFFPADCSASEPLDIEDVDSLMQVILLTDITEKKRDQRRLNRAEVNVKHANKAKSEMLLLLSHELRNPNFVITSIAKAFLENNALQQYEEDLRAIILSAEHMQTLVEDAAFLLDLHVRVVPEAQERIMMRSCSMLFNEVVTAQKWFMHLKNIKLILNTNLVSLSRLQGQHTVNSPRVGNWTTATTAAPATLTTDIMSGDTVESLKPLQSLFDKSVVSILDLEIPAQKLTKLRVVFQRLLHHAIQILSPNSPLTLSICVKQEHDVNPDISPLTPTSVTEMTTTSSPPSSPLTLTMLSSSALASSLSRYSLWLRIESTDKAFSQFSKELEMPVYTSSPQSMSGNDSSSSGYRRSRSKPLSKDMPSPTLSIQRPWRRRNSKLKPVYIPVQHLASKGHSFGSGFGIPVLQKMIDELHGVIQLESTWDAAISPQSVLSPNDTQQSTSSDMPPNLSLDATAKAAVTIELHGSGRIMNHDLSHNTSHTVNPTSLPAYKPQVLVVEDNKLVQRVISRLLTSFGCIVTTADDGQIAVEMKNLPNFDMVFMDLIMPNMNGYDAAEYIRNERGLGILQLPIVALTANSIEEERVKVLSSGHFNQFVTKPVVKATLMEIVNKWACARNHAEGAPSDDMLETIPK